MTGAIVALGAAVDTASAGRTTRPRPGTSRRAGIAARSASMSATPAQCMRFVPPAAALARADVEFCGDPRASQRPVGQLLAGLRQAGVDIDDGGRGAVPFVVHGRGRVAGGAVTLDASSSSQLVSGLHAGGAALRDGLADYPSRRARPVGAAHRHDGGHADRGGRRQSRPAHCAAAARRSPTSGESGPVG